MDEDEIDEIYIKTYGVVESVFLGIQEHGILTLEIVLDYGNTMQIFNGVALDVYDKEKQRRIGHAAGTDYILQILELFNVNNLNKIKGKSVCALQNDEFNSEIAGLQTSQYDDMKRTFILKEWQKEWEGKNA